MDSLEPDAQSFIVKVWVEDGSETVGHGVWHGHITHVPSGNRYYMKNLDEIGDFIMPYIEDMGVKPSRGWWIRRWLQFLTGRG
jgi:hypothetical protein